MPKTNDVFSQLLRFSRFRDGGAYGIAIAYALYLKNTSNEKSNNLKTILKHEADEDIVSYILDVLSDNWDDIINSVDDIDEKELTKFILSSTNEADFRMSECTPDGVSDLACSLLNIKNDDMVADYGSGSLGFIMRAQDFNSKAKYTGIEILNTQVIVAKIKSKFINGDITVERGNMLDVGYNRSFDKIFSNYPFSLRANPGDKEFPFFKMFEDEFSGAAKLSSLEWVYNRLIMTSLNKNGKAIVLMNPGSIYNTREIEIRKFFVKNGFIEAIISLPEKLFTSTQIPTMMLVLSFGNKGVKIIDAKDQFKTERRKNTLSKTNIKNIVRMYKGNDSFKSLDEIADNNFNLNPSIYNEETQFENAVAFETVIEKISRGAHCTSSELDELSTEEDTGYKYLMLSSIHDGVIDEDLPSLKELPAKLEKYVLQEGDIVISKNGAPIKVAVAENIGKKKILANGSLYIIRVDTEKVSPYYIKAFLISKIGKQLISKIVVGNVIPNIPKENILKLQIPLLSKEKQKEIIELTQAYSDEIRAYEERLARVRAKIEDIFEEV